MQIYSSKEKVDLDDIVEQKNRLSSETSILTGVNTNGAVEYGLDLDTHKGVSEPCDDNALDSDIDIIIPPDISTIPEDTDIIDIEIEAPLEEAIDSDIGMLDDTPDIMFEYEEDEINPFG